MNDLSRFGKAALLQSRLRAMSPGTHFRISNAELLNCVVPANPLDRQDGAFLAEWFRSRMPFRCTVEQNHVTGDWEFIRALHNDGTLFGDRRVG